MQPSKLTWFYTIHLHIDFHWRYTTALLYKNLQLAAKTPCFCVQTQMAIYQHDT